MCFLFFHSSRVWCTRPVGGHALQHVSEHRTYLEGFLSSKGSQFYQFHGLHKDNLHLQPLPKASHTKSAVNKELGQHPAPAVPATLGPAVVQCVEVYKRGETADRTEKIRLIAVRLPNHTTIGSRTTVNTSKKNYTRNEWRTQINLLSSKSAKASPSLILYLCKESSGSAAVAAPDTASDDCHMLEKALHN